MAVDPSDDIRTLAQHLDLIEDVIAQPGGDGADLAEMVNGLFRESNELRERLQDAVPAVLERENGDAVFNQISAVLERLERVQEQWRSSSGGSARSASAGGAAGRGALAAAPMPASPSWHEPAGSPGATLGVDQTSGASFAAFPAAQSPMASHAASSDPDASQWRQGSGISEMSIGTGKKDKKKKKEKRQEATDDFGFPGASMATGSSGGFGQTGGGWPAAGDTADAFGSAVGGDVGTGGFEASGWGSAAPGGFGDSGGVGSAWRAGDEFGGAPSGSMGSTGPANSGGFGATFGEEKGPNRSHGSPQHGSTAGAFGMPPEPDAGTSSWGAGAGPSDPPHFGDMGINHAPNSGSFSSGAFGGCGSFSGGGAGGGMGGRGSATQQATMHIRCPFSDVEHDREGFERMFVRAAAQAAGVAPHRIRVHAIRAGYS